MPQSYTVPKAMQPRYEEIVALTDRVSAELLTAEYAELARDLAATLARKRPSPLEKGTVAVWACSIVYALGRVNFLFDRDQDLYLCADALCQPFNVASRTAAAKSNTILDLLKVTPMDPRWTLPSRLGDNPMAWMVQLANGLIIDVRQAPRALQVEAFQRGMIPYLPEERH